MELHDFVLAALARIRMDEARRDADEARRAQSVAGEPPRRVFRRAVRRVEALDPELLQE